MSTLANLFRTIVCGLYVTMFFLLFPVGMLLFKVILSKKLYQKIIFFCQSKATRFLFFLGKVKIKVEGLHHLSDNNQKKILIISNHLSSFDIFTIIAITPFPVVFLSKPLYFFIPIVGFSLYLIGHIPINRKNPRKAWKSLEIASQRIREGTNVVVFPEGTRGDGQTIKSFNPSPLSLLKKSQQSAIAPITLANTDKIQKKGSLMIKSGTIYVYISPMILQAEKEISTPTGKQKLIKMVENKIKSQYLCHLEKSSS